MRGSVSVVIPTFNGERFLADAVRSVWAQTAPPSELIVVDDCSRDGTVALAESLAREAPLPLRVLRLPANSGGPARPINVGLRAATGDYVAVLDQDDVFVSDRLAAHASALDTAPTASAACGYCSDLHTPDDITQTPAIRAELEASREIAGTDVLKLLVRHGNFLWGFPGFTFRRAAAGNGIDESFRIAGDMDFIARLAERGSFALVPAVCYHRRKHAENMTRRALDSHLEDARVREEVLLRSGIGADPAVCADAGHWFRTLAFWVREAGHPVAALRLYRAVGRVWGWDRAACLDAAKVLPVWLARTATFRPPRRVTITTNR